MRRCAWADRQRCAPVRQSDSLQMLPGKKGISAEINESRRDSVKCVPFCSMFDYRLEVPRGVILITDFKDAFEPEPLGARPNPFGLCWIAGESRLLTNKTRPGRQRASAKTTEVGTWSPLRYTLF